MAEAGDYRHPPLRISGFAADSDRKGLRDDAASKSWNSSHPSRGPDDGCRTI